MFLNKELLDREDSSSIDPSSEPVEELKVSAVKKPQRIQNNRFQLKEQQQAPKRNLQQAAKKAPPTTNPSFLDDDGSVKVQDHQDHRISELESQIESKSIVQFDEDEFESPESPAKIHNSNTTTTYQQRQKLLEQQKLLLQQKQKQTYSSHGMHQNSSYLKQNNDPDLDYERLASILNQNQHTQHEPSQFKYNIDSLPQLSQMGSTVAYDQARHIQPTPIQQQTQQPRDEPVMKMQQVEASEPSDSEEEERINEESENVLMEQEKEDELRKELKQVNEKVMMAEDLKEDPKEETKTPDEVKEEPKVPLKRLIYPKPLDNLAISDMKHFLTSPCPRGGMIQCTIKRDKTGMGRFYPKYHIHLSNGFKYLMTAKKRACNNTSNYLVCMSRNDLNKNSHYFLGKVRSNFMGTEFTLYDHGENPKKKLKAGQQVRKQLGMVFYESNILGTKGPRKMKVLLPKVDEEGFAKEFKPTDSKSGMLNEYKSGNLSKLLPLVNRPPKWNEQVQAFVLNFYGRVDKPSVKNFQLVEEGGEDVILLQFGRVGEELFNLDFQYPFTPLQAFEIALSSFDYKIACE